MKAKPSPTETTQTIEPSPAEAIIALSIDQQALEAKEQFDLLQKQAITKLLSDRREIDARLEKLGYVQNDHRLPGRPPKTANFKLTVPVKRPCRVCGATDHDARRHRLDNIRRLKAAKPPRGK